MAFSNRKPITKRDFYVKFKKIAVSQNFLRLNAA